MADASSFQCKVIVNLGLISRCKELVWNWICPFGLFEEEYAFTFEAIDWDVGRNDQVYLHARRIDNVYLDELRMLSSVDLAGEAVNQPYRYCRSDWQIFALHQHKTGWKLVTKLRTVIAV